MEPTTLTQNQIAETDFEKRRGISRVEVRDGYTQVHVTGLAEPVAKSRLEVLKTIANAQVSLDFLKLTPTGLSFVIPSARTSDIEASFATSQLHHQMVTDRSIVLVHAVNMRDEEGMVAGIVRRTISAGIAIDHVTDMHDRMLIILPKENATKLQQLIEKEVA
jgi:aspartate kinase